jgi:hypothetical protein
MTEQVKVSWKIGSAELQYEGNENFLKSELPKLFRELLEIYKTGSEREKEMPQLPPIKDELPVESSNGQKLELSLNAIATKLGIRGGQNFALAACAYLALVEQKTTFSYNDIREAMKLAHQFYNENQRKNLSKYIASLMKKRFLLERTPHIYAIEGTKLKELQDALAN